MKRTKKLLALLMTITMVAGVVLSAPFMVDALTFKTYYPDTLYFRLQDGTSSSETTVKVDDETPQYCYYKGSKIADHHLVKCVEGAVPSYNGSYVARNNIAKFTATEYPATLKYSGGEDSVVFSTLAYVTMFYYAPKTMDYTINIGVNGTTGRIPIVVNDRKYYVAKQSDSTTKTYGDMWETTTKVRLDKGAGFIRIILREYDQLSKWMNLHYVDVDDNLTMLSRNGTSLTPENSKYYNAFYQEDAGKSFQHLNAVERTDVNGWCGIYQYFRHLQIRADGSHNLTCKAEKHTHSYTDVNNTFLPNYGIRAKDSSGEYKLGYKDAGGNFVVPSDNDYTTKQSVIPFVSHTVDVNVEGYYSFTYQMQTNSNASFDGEMMIAVNDWIYYKNVANYTSDGYLYYDFSLYLPAGRNVLIFAAPFSVAKADSNVTNDIVYLNLFNIYVPAACQIADDATKDYRYLVKHAGKANQISPQEISTKIAAENKGSGTQPYDNGGAWGGDSGPIYADTSGVLNGMLNDSWTTDKGGNPTFSDGDNELHYNIRNEASGHKETLGSGQVHKDALGGTLPSGFSEHHKIGGLGNLPYYQPVLQSWRSIHEDQYINKSYTPMVSYQVEVPKGGAGTYLLTTNYQVAIKEGYSHTDYYAVISVNDNQFLQAPFVDMCNGKNNPCDTHKYITDDKIKGDYMRNDADSEAGHYTINQQYVKLVEGVNTIRVIAAVYETAPMVGWMNQTYIRLQGAKKVTGIEVPNVGSENDTTQYVASHRFAWFDPDSSNGTFEDNINQNKDNQNFVSRNADNVSPGTMTKVNEKARQQYDTYAADWTKYAGDTLEVRNAPITVYDDGLARDVSVSVNTWGFNPIKCSEAGQMDGGSGQKNPRQSYFVGNAYYNYNKVTVTDKTTGASPYVAGGSYEDLYDTLKLSDLENTPCVRYKFENTGAAGYYDIDLTYKADMNNADILTEGGIPYYTVVVLHEGTAPRKYKCKMLFKDANVDLDGNKYADGGSRGKGDMYDNTANISVYLPEGESDIFIINPLDRSFDLNYGLEGEYGQQGTYCLTKNGVKSKHNWCDQGSIRIAAGKVNVYHPEDSWTEAAKENVLSYYQAVNGSNKTLTDLYADANAASYETCVDGVELLKNTVDDYIVNQTDKEKFLERRNWAIQYLSFIIQDYEGQTLVNQGADVQLMQAKIDLTNKINELTKLTYESAKGYAGLANGTGGYMYEPGWAGKIHSLLTVENINVEDWVADNSDAERINDAKAYLAQSKTNATNNSTKGDSSDLTIGTANRADTDLTSTSAELTVRDNTKTHLNAIRDAFYKDIVYDNGWDSIIAYEWEVDECYSNYMTYAEQLIKGTDEFYDLRKEYYDKSNYDNVISEIKAMFKAKGIDFDTYFGNNLDSAENAGNANRDSVNTARIPYAVRQVIETCRTDISKMTYSFDTAPASATTLEAKEDASDFTENNQRIIDRYQAMITEVTGRINALKYQMGVWTQYQNKLDVNENTKFGYVRLFFEIDPGANEYVDAATVADKNGGQSNATVRPDGNGGNVLEFTGPLYRKLTANLKGKYGFAIYMPWWDNGNPRHTEVVDLSATSGLDCKTDSIVWNHSADTEQNAGGTTTMKPNEYAGDGDGDGYCDWGNEGDVQQQYNAYYSSATGKYFVYMYIEIPKRYWGEDFYVFGYCADADGVYVSKRQIVNLQYYWDTGKNKTDIYVTK